MLKGESPPPVVAGADHGDPAAAGVAAGRRPLSSLDGCSDEEVERSRRWSAVAGLAGLTVVSGLLRLEGRNISLWLDEALSIGIASRALSEIPAALVRDGSPPLYYALLHGWMGAFGRSEAAVRSLSLLFALAMVPVAFWAGRSLFGRRAGWVAATLAATSPYLSIYAQEARMYTLLALLALVCVATFLHAFGFGRRRWLPLFVASLVLVLYTHNWGLFLAAGTGTGAALVALSADARKRARVLVDAGLAFGAAALLYAPWIPTLLAQARRTGAPWSPVPVPREVVSALGTVFGDERALVALLVAGAVPVLELMRRRRTAEGRSVLALTAILVASVCLAWAASQLQLGWSTRYFSIFLAPVLLIAALALSRAGAPGLVALSLIVLLWTQPLGRLTGLRPSPTDDDKSNVRQVAAAVSPLARPGDVMVSTQMEQIPVLRYYFGPQLIYADPMGPVDDPTTVDWRDALDRMASATPATGLDPIVDSLPAGGRILLACPRVSAAEGDLLWDRLMDSHCQSWRAALEGDPEMNLILPRFPPPMDQETGTSVYVLVYEKRS